MGQRSTRSYKDMSLDDYVRRTARELGRDVSEGRVSPVQLFEMALSLAKRTEPAVNAYVCFLDDYALAVAREREDEVREGRIRGPLHGVPIAIKDNFHLTGHPVRKGSRTTTESPATYDSPMVERIVRAGAVIIGKTTMPEFGWKGTGISPLTGVTHNPWNPGRNSGGSSAGSAASVAAGAVPIALGSDAGGSVRIPASFCGVVGLKPTLSRVPVYPGTVTETLSHVGPLCRTVDDARLVLAATEGVCAKDPLSYAARPHEDTERRRRFSEGTLRIGVIGRPFEIAPDPQVAKVFSAAVGRIRRDVPASYDDGAALGRLPRAVFETLWVTGRGLGFKEQFESDAASMDPGLVRLGALAKEYDVSRLFRAMEERRTFVSYVCALFERFDLLVMPTMPLTAFAADAEVPDGGEASAPLPWITWTPYTYPFNLTGQPAISLPCGVAADGLPVGLQVVGAWGEDELVLDFAERIERVLTASASGFPPCLQAALSTDSP
jgi:aspartyl-tRNA(Asn)/glutamyl-tRNA(Gln) amidotransferase subunit A